MNKNLKRRIVEAQNLAALHSKNARECFNRGWYNSAIDYQERAQRAYKRARDLMGVDTVATCCVDRAERVS